MLVEDEAHEGRSAGELHVEDEVREEGAERGVVDERVVRRGLQGRQVELGQERRGQDGAEGADGALGARERGLDQGVVRLARHAGEGSEPVRQAGAN